MVPLPPGGRLTECQLLGETSYYYIVPNKTLYFKVRIQKAPSGRELRRKAVRESACNCDENSDLSVSKSEMIRKQVGIQILICTPGSFRQPYGCHLPPEEGSLKCQVLKGTAYYYGVPSLTKWHCSGRKPFRSINSPSFFVDSTTNRRVRERNLGITATSFAEKRQNTQIYKNVFYRSNFIHKNFDNFAKKLLTMHFLFDRMKVNNNVLFLSAGESTFWEILF